MKPIKSSLLILLALVITPVLLWGQEYKIPIQNSRDGRLILTNFTGDLPIEGFNGNVLGIPDFYDMFEITGLYSSQLKGE